MKYFEAVRDGLYQSLRRDEKVICYGLGVPDPKNIFGTTKGLQEAFGSQRVFDMPLSENTMTGVAIGAAMRGYRPVMVHQRFDFFLLAMDQLVNGAAKWHMMFGGQASIPLTIRLIVGRGWGQGPTHCQSLHAWLAHVPGLKVIMPSNPADAKGMLMEAIRDPNPVVMIEHRWLHGMEGEVPSGGDYRVSLDKARVLHEGTDVTVVGTSLMIPEALHAIDFLGDRGISVELIDLRSVRPIDWETVMASVKKTRRLLALDIGAATVSVASEIIARVTMELNEGFASPPQRIALPDFAVPTGFSLTKEVYPDSYDIAASVLAMFGQEGDPSELRTAKTWPHDVPGDWFSGPF